MHEEIDEHEEIEEVPSSLDDHGPRRRRMGAEAAAAVRAAGGVDEYPADYEDADEAERAPTARRAPSASSTRARGSSLMQDLARVPLPLPRAGCANGRPPLWSEVLVLG